jgi:hypothetical protein
MSPCDTVASILSHKAATVRQQRQAGTGLRTANWQVSGEAMSNSWALRLPRRVRGRGGQGSAKSAYVHPG